MASTTPDDLLLALDQHIEKLKDEIKKHTETVDRLNREHHETRDATRHLDSLRQQYSSILVAASGQRKH